MYSENQPLVSVLLPSYNHAKYVQSTIKSIIEQEYQNIELLVIDDGSTDSSWDMINELKADCEERFTNIDFSRQENKGLCTTLNTLVQKAKGEYLFIIASDDTAMPNALKVLVSFLGVNPDYVLAVGDNYFMDGDGRRVFWSKNRQTMYNEKYAPMRSFGTYLQLTRPDVDFSSESFGDYNSLLRGNYLPNGYLIRQSAMLRTGGYRLDAPLEDLWMSLQLSKLGKFKYIDEPLYYYRWHSTNTSHAHEHMEEITVKTLKLELKLMNEKVSSMIR